MDPATFNERIEALTAALDASPDARARDLARELVRLVLEFHKGGLSRLIAALDGSPQARARLLADPAVRGVLALHDLDLPPAPQLIQISRRTTTPPQVDAPPDVAHGGVCARCGASLPREHRHVVDVASRRLSCACRACWLLAEANQGSRPEQAVPDRCRHESDLRLTPAQWDALQIPVDIAFFMHNSVAGRTIAFYPSPAGATESALALALWGQIAEANPWVRAIAPDVEALLVRRERSADTYSCFVVPIDACYELVGRIRLSWTGLTGGSAVQAAIDEFFADVAARSAEGAVAGCAE